MSRAALLILVALGILVGWLGRGSRPVPTRTVPPIDSSRVDSLKAQARAAHLRDSAALDSLRKAFRERSIREVLRYLPGHRDTIRDTAEGEVVVESVMVAAPVIRETADSLATCRTDRAALARDIATWTARDSIKGTALDSIARTPAPAPEKPSSVVPWAAGGFLAGIATTAITIIAITR